MSIDKIDQPAPIQQRVDGRIITNLMYLLWRSRDDLQGAYDLATRSGQQGLIDWFDAYVNPDRGIARSEATQMATGPFTLELADAIAQVALGALTAGLSQLDDPTDHALPILLAVLHRHSPALQVAFDVDSVEGRLAFKRWFRKGAAAEFLREPVGAGSSRPAWQYSLGNGLFRIAIAEVPPLSELENFVWRHFPNNAWLSVLVSRPEIRRLSKAAIPGMPALQSNTDQTISVPLELDRQFSNALFDLCCSALDRREELDTGEASPVTRLMALIHARRPDLQLAFDIGTAAGRLGLAQWTKDFANREYGWRTVQADSQIADSALHDWGGVGMQPSLTLAMLEKAMRPRVLANERGYATSPYDRPFIHPDKPTLSSIQSHTSASTTGNGPLSIEATANAAAHLLPFGVNLIGYVHTESGVGEHVRMTSRALTEAGVPFTMIDFTIGVPSRQQADFVSSVPSDPRFGINLLHVNADHILTMLLHFGRDYFRGRRNIFYCFWELSKFPDRWKEIIELTGVDEVWAPTKFIQKSISDSLGRQVPHMPVPIELPPFERKGRVHFGLDPGRYYFLVTFDAYSHIDRKNPYAAVEAFRRAFPVGTENVGLILKAMNAYEASPKWQRLLAMVKGDSRIRIINRTMERAGLLALKAECDCYVSLHRAEGLGLGPLEAMLLGLPTIVTNYSGVTDYANSDNAFLVGYRLIPVQEGQYIFYDGQVWAEPNLAEAAAHMRELAFHRPDGQHAKPDQGRAVPELTSARCGQLYRAEILRAYRSGV